MQSHECNTKTPTDLQTSNICWVYFILLQQRLDHRERNAVDVLAVSRETHCILAQTNSVLALRNTIGLLQVFLVNVRVWEVHFHPQDSHIVLHLQRASIDSKKISGFGWKWSGKGTKTILFFEFSHLQETS